VFIQKAEPAASAGVAPLDEDSRFNK
jgi:hypothetical protein